MRREVLVFEELEIGIMDDVKLAERGTQINHQLDHLFSIIQ